VIFYIASNGLSKQCHSVGEKSTHDSTGESLNNYYTFESVHDGDHNGMQSQWCSPVLLPILNSPGETAGGCPGVDHTLQV